MSKLVVTAKMQAGRGPLDLTFKSRGATDLLYHLLRRSTDTVQDPLNIVPLIPDNHTISLGCRIWLCLSRGATGTPEMGLSLYNIYNALVDDVEQQVHYCQDVSPTRPEFTGSRKIATRSSTKFHTAILAFSALMAQYQCSDYAHDFKSQMQILVIARNIKAPAMQELYMRMRVTSAFVVPNNKCEAL